MQTTQYDDYKYGMQDTTRIYIGSKYTFAELMKAESIVFKFQLMVKKYILPEVDPEDTLESHLYYLEPDTFLVELYTQLKARVKVNVIKTKISLTGKMTNEYVTKTLTVEELSKISPEKKEEQGMVIQELSVSKLALLSI